MRGAANRRPQPTDGAAAGRGTRPGPAVRPAPAAGHCDGRTVISRLAADTPVSDPEIQLLVAGLGDIMRSLLGSDP